MTEKQLKTYVQNVVRQELIGEAKIDYANAEIKKIKTQVEKDVRDIMRKASSQLKKFKGKIIKTNGGRSAKHILNITVRGANYKYSVGLDTKANTSTRNSSSDSSDDLD